MGLCLSVNGLPVSYIRVFASAANEDNLCALVEPGTYRFTMYTHLKYLRLVPSLYREGNVLGSLPASWEIARLPGANRKSNILFPLKVLRFHVPKNGISIQLSLLISSSRKAIDLNGVNGLIKRGHQSLFGK